jgi:phosphatidate phosphatase PAH1
MEKVVNLASKMKTYCLDLNKINFDGCMDIIVCKDKHGRLSSTPFHVRFGRITENTIIPIDKTVNIEINGCILTDLYMKVAESGIAHFPSQEEFKTKLSNPEVSSSISNNSINNSDKDSLSSDDASYSNIKYTKSLPQLCEENDNFLTIDEYLKASNTLKNFFDNTDEDDEILNLSVDSKTIKTPTHLSNRTHLNSRELEMLCLQHGMNEIKYFIKNSTKKCLTSYIYLWNYDDKIIGEISHLF